MTQDLRQQRTNTRPSNDGRIRARETTIREERVKSRGSLEEGWLLEGGRRDSFEEEVLGLGLEGWIEVFHVKKTEGESKKRELPVQRFRGVRGWPCLESSGVVWPEVGGQMGLIMEVCAPAKEDLSCPEGLHAGTRHGEICSLGRSL